MQARDIMTSPVVTMGPDSTINEVAEAMLAHKVSCVPVVDGGKLVGILSHSDFNLHHTGYPLADNLYKMFDHWADISDIEGLAQRLRNRKVKDVMRNDVVTIQEDATVADVAETMLRQHVNRLPVMRGKDLVGIISRHDLLKLMTEHD